MRTTHLMHEYNQLLGMHNPKSSLLCVEHVCRRKTRLMHFLFASTSPYARTHTPTKRGARINNNNKNRETPAAGAAKREMRALSAVRETAQARVE